MIGIFRAAQLWEHAGSTISSRAEVNCTLGKRTNLLCGPCSLSHIWLDKLFPAAHAADTRECTAALLPQRHANDSSSAKQAMPIVTIRTTRPQAHCLHRVYICILQGLRLASDSQKEAAAGVTPCCCHVLLHGPCQTNWQTTYAQPAQRSWARSCWMSQGLSQGGRHAASSQRHCGGPA